MAKKKIKSSKKLIPYKEITVKSRAYGEHTRAARGSKTPIELNNVFTEHKEKTKVINSIAKRIHDLLKKFGGGFKEAMLWQTMLSRMRKGISNDMTGLLIALKGMELNPKYPLQRFLNIPPIKVEKNKKKVTVRFTNSMAPDIRSSDTQYRIEVYLLALGKEVKQDHLLSNRTEWTEKEMSIGEVLFAFDLPDKMSYYLVCLRLMTGNNGRETGTLASRGMCIAGIGKA